MLAAADADYPSFLREKLYVNYFHNEKYRMNSWKTDNR